ncbi:hypothetical protein ABBQ38_014415 [Trebouxia sp. C0009 RCD-2024]
MHDKLYCPQLQDALQVNDSKSIARAVAAAWPRQALALTLAHWELATKTSCMLGRLSPTMPSNGVEAPINPAAGSLLLLSSLVSKASCSVQQPLPDQAMDAWQHAPWPTGDTDLLCMGMVLAADPALQSFVLKMGSQQDSSQSQAAGKLQQMVIAAATLLSELAVCASDALTPMTVDEDGTGEESPRSGQSQGLHPAVVSALAVRVFQLSNGNPTAAMAFLVASVLPEWELDLPPRAQPAEAGLVHQGTFGVADGQVPNSDGDMSPSVLANRARQRSYRKRARSPSRSPFPGKSLLHSSKTHSAKRRRSRSVSSQSNGSSTTTSSSSNSASHSGSSSRSSGSSSGSGIPSSHPSRSSQDASMKSDPGRQQYARAISEGLQPMDVAMDMEQSLSVDWTAVEAAGNFGTLPVVRQGFQQLSLPVEPSQEPQDFEEGEIRAADLDMKRSHAVHWSLNWALYETLHGQTPNALSALQAALETADDNTHLQQQVWKETLEFASATLLSQTAANTPAAAAGLGANQQPLGLRQKLKLLQQFLTWQQKQAVLPALALPQLPIQDKKASALLQQPTFQDGEGMREAALTLLRHASPAEEVVMTEWVVSRAPATAAKAQLLLDLAARQPQEGQYASWMLPLAATALLNAAPPAAPHLWLQAIVLADKHSVAAAKELSTLAVARHPHSNALAKRHAALKPPTVVGANKHDANL